MKFLIVILAAVLVAQFADAAPEKASVDDLIEAFQEQQYLEEEQYVANVEELATEDIPTILRSCDNASCNSICRALGFARGICISSTTCRCYSS